MERKELLAGLAKSGAFPVPGPVEIRHTHISVVFLVGDEVYKVKKPVHFGFVDFTTLAKRHHYCLEEVRLNRRLAPNVYVGVEPITIDSTGLIQVAGPGEVVEWCVHMRRLDETRTLASLLARNAVSASELCALGTRLASFHATAERTAASAAQTQPEAIAKTIMDVLDGAEAQRGRTVSSAVHQRVHDGLQQQLATLAPLLRRRADEGRGCDCHGDLHLGHIYRFPERPPPHDLVIIDCIEFNARLRLIDPVADMAFVRMDLGQRGFVDLAEAFTRAYFAAANDPDGAKLLPLFTAYRATVRGLVDGIAADDNEVPPAARAAARKRARRYWLFALGELEPPNRRPALVLVAGLPGTGKSTLAKALADQHGFTVMRSDVVRQRLFGAGRYDEQANASTYEALRADAEAVLSDGGRVVVDANFRTACRRRPFLALAAELAVPVVALVAEAPAALCYSRLAQRTNDASEADAAAYDLAATEWQPWPEAIAVDGRQSRAQMAHAAAAALRAATVI